jgi:hypothetical protein
MRTPDLTTTNGNHRGRQRLNGLSAAMLSAALLAGPVHAADFRYTYLEGGYQRVDIDSPNVDGDGLFVGGSLLVSQSVFFTAGYDYTEFNRGVDARSLNLGIGLRMPASPDVDVVFEGGYVDARVDTRFGNFDDDGYFVSGGVRWRLNELVELNGGLRYVDLDDSGSDVGLGLGVVIDVRPHWSVLAGGAFADDADSLSIGFRYYFDR